MALQSFTPFTNIYNDFQSTITSATSSFGSGMVSLVAAPLGVASTVYIMLLGYSILRGAIQMPVRELAWQMAKLGAVITAAGASFYSSVIVSGVPAIATAIISAGGGSQVSNAGSMFDAYMNNAHGIIGSITDALSAAVANVSITNFPSIIWPLICSVIAIMVIYVFAILSSIVGFCILLFAMLGLQICVALAPLAFASLIFNSSKFFFDGWLKQTLNFSLLMVIMSIVTNIINSMVTKETQAVLSLAGSNALTAGTTGSGAIIDAGAVLVIMVATSIIYTVGTIFFFETPKIASGIVGGSASGGHGFLQAGMNAMMNRYIARMGSNAPKSSSGNSGTNSLSKGE